MWCCYDDAMLIAFHESHRVVRTYAQSILKHHGIDLDLKKISNKRFYEENPNMQDYYLVKFYDTYIQSGYLLYEEIGYSKDQIVSECNQVVDILTKLLELYNLKKKEVRAVQLVIRLISRMKHSNDDYVPSMKELRRLKDQFEPYLLPYQE